MSNEYYTPSGSPSSNSQIVSNPIRSEFVAMQAGFDKLPVMAGHVNHLVYVQSASQLAAASPDSLGLATQVELDAEVVARNAAILVETNNRTAADAAEVTARNAAILVETNARIAAVAAEAAVRSSGDASLTTQLSGKVSLDTAQTITGRKQFTANDAAGALGAQFGTGFTGVYSESTGTSGTCFFADIVNSATRFFNFRINGGLVGSITTNGTTTSYNTTSDYRLKHDVVDLADYWDVVLGLRPVSFKWNSDNSESVGFIAHEVAEHLPEAVTGDKDGEVFQMMDSKAMIPFLLKAIQDLHQRVSELEGAA